MYSLFERRWPYECYQININVDFIHLWTHRNASSTSATACFRSSRSRRRMRIEEYKESNPTRSIERERAKSCLFHCKWDSQSARTRCHLHDVDGELLKQSENPSIAWFMRQRKSSEQFILDKSWFHSDPQLECPGPWYWPFPENYRSSH